MSDQGRYKIVRYFQKDGMRNKTLKRGVSLAEAQAHCRDPETSSRTCQTAERKAITKRHGAWFDGYDHD